MKNRKFLITTVGIFFLAVVFSFLFYVRSFYNPEQPVELSVPEKNNLNKTIYNNYFQSALTYPNFINADFFQKQNLILSARSVIMADVYSGSILFERNADEAIPPASMTKLVVMYVVQKEIKEGTLSYTDVVPLAPESWWVNAPEGSSLMFLEQGQRVTVEDLLLGMAVMSGNDAATAIACFLSGSVQEFVKRMNEEVKALGLENTFFYDASGYSEKNLTTARDFINFCRTYILEFPESIEKFHSKQTFTFNGVTHKSTNKVLGLVDGVDGLKTGFINESGYNLALTAKRNDTRFIAIFMGGVGFNSNEGNRNRVSDSRTILDWGFNKFTTVVPNYKSFTKPVFQGEKNSIILVPAYTHPFSVPLNTNNSILTAKIVIPNYLVAPIETGTKYGEIIYYQEDLEIGKIPLVADRKISSGNKAKIFVDKVAKKTFNFISEVQ